jgi:hypothetical protein
MSLHDSDGVCLLLIQKLSLVFPFQCSGHPLDLHAVYASRHVETLSVMKSSYHVVVFDGGMQLSKHIFVAVNFLKNNIIIVTLKLLLSNLYYIILCSSNLYWTYTKLRRADPDTPINNFTVGVSALCMFVESKLDIIIINLFVSYYHLPQMVPFLIARSCTHLLYSVTLGQGSKFGLSMVYLQDLVYYYW